MIDCMHADIPAERKAVLEEMMTRASAAIRKYASAGKRTHFRHALFRSLTDPLARLRAELDEIIGAGTLIHRGFEMLTITASRKVKLTLDDPVGRILLDRTGSKVYRLLFSEDPSDRFRLGVGDRYTDWYTCEVPQSTVDLQTIAADDLAAILAVREVEDEIVRGHIRLVRRMANKFAIMDAGLDYDDLYSEGMQTLADAAYHFRSDLGVKFTTYCAVAMKRRMLKAILRSCDLVPNEHDTRRIVEFYRTRLHMLIRCRGNVSREDVFDAMRLEEEERIILRRLLVRFHSEGGVDVEDIPDRQPDPLTTLIFDESMERAKLTDLERDVVIAVLEDQTRGFKTRIAKGHLNRNGKPVTREWTRQALRRACEKMKIGV